jgi:polysaccharide deacetylase family protein (PEP-CTERM system associated)
VVVNALTVDVEEYFHPSEVASSVDRSTWSSLPSRAEHQVDTTLALLDRHKVRATFFILGWIATHYPAVVRKISAGGHEIGCHSYSHDLVYNMTPAQFREDTFQAVRAIEDACCVRPIAYRAPSYSITHNSMWALDVLAELGFRYDSSIYPVKHDRYGIPGFSRHPIIFETASGPITEVPVGTVLLRDGTVAPVGGGGYLRLLPYCYTAAGIRRVNNIECRPVCIYFHPWELDPDQPKLASGLVAQIRTYTGLRAMEGKIERLLRTFRFSTLSSVYSGTAAAAGG